MNEEDDAHLPYSQKPLQFLARALPRNSRNPCRLRKTTTTKKKMATQLNPTSFLASSELVSDDSHYSLLTHNCSVVRSY